MVIPRQLRAHLLQPLPHKPHQALGSPVACARELQWGSRSTPRAGMWVREMASDRAGDEPISDVKFLTVAEVAAAMRVSNMTVYRLVHSGELPAARVGRSFRVPESAVNEYLRRSYFQAG
jgi:excisionase family DNA binding protein